MPVDPYLPIALWARYPGHEAWARSLCINYAACQQLAAHTVRSCFAAEPGCSATRPAWCTCLAGGGGHPGCWGMGGGGPPEVHARITVFEPWVALWHNAHPASGCASDTIEAAQHKGCSYVLWAAYCPHDGVRPCTVWCYGVGALWQRCHLELPSCCLTVGRTEQFRGILTHAPL